MTNKTQLTLPISIWYLHGANASPTSFSWLDEHLRSDPRLDNASVVRVSYNCQESTSDIAQQLAEKLPTDQLVYLIGHSLGGVIAVAAAQRAVKLGKMANIGGVVTISAPLSGSESADVLQWLFPSYHLFRNISTKNRLVQEIQSEGAIVPTLCLITTSGNNPLIHEANDGVVTVNSQRSLKGAEKIELAYNHFEILLGEETVDYIRTFILNHPKEAQNYLTLREDDV
jgi:predicted alpha/beta hydrolase family esterase